MGAAEIVPGIALGALGVSAVDQLMRNEYKNSAVKPGEVTFEVDGKKVPAKTFHETPPENVKIEAPTFKADETGLDRAYENPKGTYYDPSTKTLYVKGSVTATDWVDDARDSSHLTGQTEPRDTSKPWTPTESSNHKARTSDASSAIRWVGQ